MSWDGLEEHRAKMWQRQLHLFGAPFYYIEYGIAQMGALQVWRHSLADQAKAVRQYRAALALGGTQGLPEIYRTAGARLVFDAETMGELVALVENRLSELRAAP
jgi:oligoendopeptidase F